MPSHCLSAFALLITIASAAVRSEERDVEFDVLFRGALIVDGTGEASFRGDVGVKDGRIAAVGDLTAKPSRQTIDARGLMLTPGFVDLHTHADRGILEHRAAENYVRQGATTLVVGNCGSSPVDAAAFLNDLEEGGAGVNVVFLIGHGSVRQHVIGDRDVAPTDEQLAEMKTVVRRAMEAGAAGMSSGLRYRPGAYASTDEVAALARELAPFGGFYATHIRDEGEHILEALDEALAIGREAKVPVHVSHHKISSASVWGLTRLTLAAIEKARAEGMDVTLDHYPYGAGSSGISLMAPQSMIAGGSRAFRERMQDKATRRKTLDAVVALIKKKLFEPGQSADRPEHVRVALARIQVARLAADESLEGKNLSEILAGRGTPISVESGAELIVELIGKGAQYHTIDNREGGDVERVMRYPHASVASDGSVFEFGEGHPHPRSYGTYPRVLARYVREKEIISWEQAIHKMTGLPAQRLGWKDRGLIKPGYAADLAVFDPEKITDVADFKTPHLHSVGVQHVMVNGRFVLKSGKLTGELAGRPIRRTMQKAE